MRDTSDALFLASIWIVFVLTLAATALFDTRTAAQTVRMAPSDTRLQIPIDVERMPTQQDMRIVRRFSSYPWDDKAPSWSTWRVSAVLVEVVATHECFLVTSTTRSADFTVNNARCPQ
jgi:hypothetical protein